MNIPSVVSLTFYFGYMYLLKFHDLLVAKDLARFKGSNSSNCVFSCLHLIINEQCLGAIVYIKNILRSSQAT